MFASKDTLLTRPSGYNIARSVRLRSSASAYFNRTLTTATNNKIWTWSAWVKRGTLGVDTCLFSGGTTSGDANQFNIRFNASSDTITMSSDVTNWRITSQVFRDPSSWYHFVLAVDTTQATAANRILFYINGVQVTAFSSSNNPTQNTTLGVNTASAHNLARRVSGSDLYFDGYLTEINFIDGQALTPSSFGETDSITGVWKPKAYSGTYGTNGFYLNFSDNSAVTTSSNVGIGKDFSGNGNYWTSNSINVSAYTGTPPNNVNYDSMVDSPTVGATSSNYAVLNPVDLGYSATLSEANLKVSTASAGNAASASTMALSTNTYWEVTIGSNSQVGLIWGRASDAFGNSSISMFASGTAGSLVNATRTLSATPSWSNGDTLGFAWNNSTRVLTLYQAGSATAVMTMTTPATGDPNVAVINNTSGAVMSSQVNFGQRPFSYTPPTGFVALNTYNLPASTVTNGAAYMAATTYTGTGASLTVANTVGSASFQPDWVWVKGRSGATDHALYDSVRGVQKQIESNNTGAETTETTGLTAFGSTGFTVGALAQMNTSAATYVAWQWLAGGTAVSNTNGTITSTVSAGATQGFSVVTYTGSGSAATVGHGLGVAPSFVIVKFRTEVENWYCYHASIGNTKAILLNTTGAATSASATYWNNTTPTSSVVSLGGTTSAPYTYVMYAFSAVAGYSAFGSYTGNGSSDGPFVYLGFRPRFVMIKGSSDADRAWVMIDTSRNTANVMNLNLYANASDAEATDTRADGLSNGFKVRGTGTWVNNSASTYIYMAFAENPFKNSLAR